MQGFEKCVCFPPQIGVWSWHAKDKLANIEILEGQITLKEVCRRPEDKLVQLSTNETDYFMNKMS